MSIGIGNEHEVLPLQVVLGFNEVLRVTANGQFVWNPDADRMIEEGDFRFNPELPHILRALRKREWVGLTDEEVDKAWRSVDYTVPWEQHRIDIARALEAALKERNT
jgi:hypothetical protein